MTTSQKINVLKIINDSVTKIQQSLEKGHSVFVKLDSDNQVELFDDKLDNHVCLIDGEETISKDKITTLKQYFLAKKGDDQLVIKQAKEHNANLTFFVVQKNNLNDLKHDILDKYLQYISATIFNQKRQKSFAKKLCLLFAHEKESEEVADKKIQRNIDPRVASLSLILENSNTKILNKILSAFTDQQDDQNLDDKQLDEQIKKFKSRRLVGGSSVSEKQANVQLEQISDAIESSTQSGELFQSLISSYIILNRTQQYNN